MSLVEHYIHNALIQHVESCDTVLRINLLWTITPKMADREWSDLHVVLPWSFAVLTFLFGLRYEADIHNLALKSFLEPA